jgi:hypothetical protein
MRAIFWVAAAIFAGTAPAGAGQAPTAAGPTATISPAVDPNRLPVNVGRIGRQLQRVQERAERDGLKLRYTINVYGESPRLQIVTPLDNLRTGNLPRSTPTHADMIRMMTPHEFSAPAIGFTVPGRK